jgi:hypothetical protein
MPLQDQGVVPFPSVGAFLDKPWVGCLVVEEAREVTFQALLHDRQSLKDVLSRWKACYNAELRGCNGPVVNFWVRRVADDRGYVVDGKAGSQKRPNAFVVRRGLRSQSRDLIQGRPNEEENATAEVAIHEERAAGHLAWMIWTWSCCCCQFLR